MEAEHAKHHEFELIINRQDFKWPQEQINGADIKKLAGSPADWIVNEIVAGSGEDPEIGDQQPVNLAKDSPPKGTKRFVTRKPKTAPGSN